jgi:DNA polymerase III subunit epsilon
MSVLSWLAPWRRRASAPSLRWVMLDVETTGLDTRRDKLLAIAALAIRLDGPRVQLELADSFEVVLHQTAAQAAPDKNNILLHGIGLGAQAAGVEPRVAMQAFNRYVDGAPLLGFHVAFDQAVLERQARLLDLPSPGSLWLDVEPLAAVLRPDIQARSLDEWMAALDITCAVRHRASSDVLASCELLLKLWPRLLRAVPEAARGDAQAVLDLAAQRHWLGR